MWCYCTSSRPFTDYSLTTVTGVVVSAACGNGVLAASPCHCTDLPFCAAQVLHVAVLRKQQAAVEALLELGLSPTLHNSRRWTSLDEAVSLKDAALVKPLYLRRVANMKAELKAKKALLMESLGSMPDYTMKVCSQLVLKAVCWWCSSCECHGAAGQSATVQLELQERAFSCRRGAWEKIAARHVCH